MQSTSSLWQHGLIAVACATLTACGGSDHNPVPPVPPTPDTTTSTQTSSSPYKLHTPDGQTTSIKVTSNIETVTRTQTGALVSRTHILSMDGRGTLTSTDDWKSVTPVGGTMPIASGKPLLNNAVVAWCSRQWGDDATHLAIISLNKPPLAFDNLNGRTLRSYSCDANDKLEGKSRTRFQGAPNGGMQISSDTGILTLTAAQVAQMAKGEGVATPNGHLKLMAQTLLNDSKAVVVAQLTPLMGSVKQPSISVLIEE